MAVIKTNANDRKLLARLIRAEAEGEGELGMLLVANVCVNRVRVGCLDFVDIHSIERMVWQSPGGFEAVRKGGNIQITGVYSSRYNGFPLGDIFQRNVNIRTGQAPVIHYMPYLHDLIATGKVDPGDVVTHILPLDQAKHGYEIFDTKMDNCIKVVLKP